MKDWSKRATRRTPALTATLAALLMAATQMAATAGGSTLEGRLRVAGGGAGELAGAVVYFEPATPVAAPPAGSYEIVTVKKAFAPRVLAVPVGSTVRFPNRDPILHNVFSVSGENRFDLGLVRRGEGGEATFDTPGVVRVFCNVHHAMVAYVVVLDTPFFVQPDDDGTFRLDGLPAGRGKLTVWHERAEPWRRELELPHAAPLEVAIEPTRPRVPRHLNKLGKPYKKLRGRRYDG